MVLVADISSSWIKFAPATDEGVHEGGMVRIPRREMTAERWAEVLSGHEGAAFAAVGDGAGDLLEEAAQAAGVPVFRLTAATAPLDFAGYPEPATIGADRLANAVEACAGLDAGKAVLVVDAGTAVTVDAVVAGEPPAFRGGAIAPGRLAFAGALASHAPQLPVAGLRDAEAAPPLGQSTLEALGSALRFGWPGMIAGVLDAQAGVLRQDGTDDPIVMIAGGDAANLAGGLKGKWSVRLAPPTFTLEGILRAAIPSLSGADAPPE